MVGNGRFWLRGEGGKLVQGLLWRGSDGVVDAVGMTSGSRACEVWDRTDSWGVLLEAIT